VLTKRLNDPERVDPVLFEWLMHETVEFLTDPAAPPVDRRAQAALALARASRTLQGLVTTGIGYGTVVAVDIEVTGPDGSRRAWNAYRELPSPLELLVICTARAKEGDRVAVVIHRSGSPPLCRHELWPFGFARAEQITRPAS
jgi:hypothetical protein